MWEVSEDEEYDDWDGWDDEPVKSRYTTTDHGAKAEHTDGVVRDTQTGKTLFPLMFPKGVPMEDQLIVRLAELYTRGALKYGDRNWENSKAEDTLEHHTEALWRHFMNFFFEVQDGEDHAAAVLWNVNAVDLTRRNIAKGKKKAKKRKKHKALKINPDAPVAQTQGEKDANWVEKHPPFTLAKLYEWRASCDVTGVAYPVLNYLDKNIAYPVGF